MFFEEIIPSIMNSMNSFEIALGIKTTKVECWVKRENWAVFVGFKDDNSKTLFLARKGKRAPDDKWNWHCPSEDEIKTGYPIISEIYENLNKQNEQQRWKPLTKMEDFM